MSNNLVLRKAGLRQVTCIVRERQLRLYGRVARLRADDPANRDSFFWKPEWLDHAEALQASVLRQIKCYLRDILLMSGGR